MIHAGQKPHVLIVDDAEEVLLVEEALFSKAGAEVTCISDPIAALDLYKTQQKSTRPFDLIALDIRLPKMSGNALAKALRDAGYTGPLVAFTVNASMEGKREGEDAGFDVYFSKTTLKKDLIVALLDRYFPDRPH